MNVCGRGVLAVTAAGLLAWWTIQVEVSPAAKPSEPPARVSTVLPGTVRLSLADALSLFLKQNLDLLIARYGIDYSKGQQITAKLFPNPFLLVGTQASWTQGNTLTKSGEIQTQVQQLFEVAGKRGYRIESAGFGAQSSEAGFEDVIRQLSFTLKDAYYRVQLAQRRLALAEENRDRFA